MNIQSDQSVNRPPSMWRKKLLTACLIALAVFSTWRTTKLVQTSTRWNELMQANLRDHELLLSNGKQVADRFLEEVREGRLDSAYALVSTSFRQRTGREDFERYVMDHSTLREPLPATGWGAEELSILLNSRVENGLWHDTVICDQAKAVWKFRTNPSRPGGPHATIEVVLVVEQAAVRIEQCNVEKRGGEK